MIADEWLKEIETIKQAAHDILEGNKSFEPHVQAGARAVLAFLPVFLDFVQSEEKDDEPNHITGCGIYRAFGVLIGLYLRFKVHEEFKGEATQEAVEIVRRFANAYTHGNLEYLNSGMPN